MNTIVFINCSENRRGNTYRLGQELLKGHSYQEIDLVDYKINQIGQKFNDDQFEEVYQQIEQADQIVLGTPVYWHTISAYLKTLMERLSQRNPAPHLDGKRVYLLVQGADPSDTIGPATKLLERFCTVLNMNFVGTASTDDTLSQLVSRL